MNTIGCPTKNELASFNTGRLPDEETVQIGEHPQ